jgi:hypothetical protein
MPQFKVYNAGNGYVVVRPDKIQPRELMKSNHLHLDSIGKIDLVRGYSIELNCKDLNKYDCNNLPHLVSYASRIVGDYINLTDNLYKIKASFIYLTSTMSHDGLDISKLSNKTDDSFFNLTCNPNTLKLSNFNRGKCQDTIKLVGENGSSINFTEFDAAKLPVGNILNIILMADQNSEFIISNAKDSRINITISSPLRLSHLTQYFNKLGNNHQVDTLTINTNSVLFNQLENEYEKMDSSSKMGSSSTAFHYFIKKKYNIPDNIKIDH